MTHEQDLTGPTGAGLWDAALDLATGSACVGCHRPGRLLCGPCEAALPARGALVRPGPLPPGLPPTWAAAPYTGLVRALVLGHKERARHAHARPLAGLLAHACAGLVAARLPAGAGDGVHLVPVPSRPGVVRARGHDGTRTLTRGAARALRRVGLAATCTPLLRHLGGAVDQAGLDAAARAANQAGTLVFDDRALRRALRRLPRGVNSGSTLVVIVCDDVVTTGSTLAEAGRALAAGDVPALGAATVAATPRGLPSPGRAVHTGDPRLSSGGQTH